MELVAEDLAAFAAFAQHRNFTRAAAELHVSQPALHTRIRKLEGRLGARLYLKHGRQLQLTEAGERLAAFANDTKDRAADFLGSLDAAPPRPLVLMAGSGAYLYLLGDPIRRFLAQEARAPAAHGRREPDSRRGPGRDRRRRRHRARHPAGRPRLRAARRSSRRR